MGAISPAPVVDEAVLERVRARIIAPTLAGLAAEGTPYVGVLYAGLMVDEAGDPRVVEFNCRFGDPETQAVLPRVTDDLYPWLLGAARGELPAGNPAVDSRVAVHVVMASAGYPATSTHGTVIEGVDAAASSPGCVLFHAGTARDADGTWRSAGGRVLGITALGDNAAHARELAYAGIAHIHGDGLHARGDIAAGLGHG
jgi:phosphoribosylamine--glycine ligase